MLSLKSLLPDIPMATALSAAHLAALLLPTTLRRLYVAADNDPAGHRAAARFTLRSGEAEIQTHLFLPHHDDWNTDICKLGSHQALADLAARLTREDAPRFARGTTSKT